MTSKAELYLLYVIVILFYHTQCIQPDEACTSINVEIILAMMMYTKTSTRTLVVVSDDETLQPGEQIACGSIEPLVITKLISIHNKSMQYEYRRPAFKLH